ncbi:hypothetical protein N7470_002231 [Penicillium chermesinum]|nr:hypothetical protein N7470_002231 [Penicillium chermesinum]
MTIYVDHNVKFHLRLNPLKALILQCPNLKRLSIDEKLDSLFYKQPIGHMPYVIRPKFPPIESIYMNSANVLVDNAWKPEFQFDKLVSLFIGRRCMGWPLVLGMGAAGNFWNLKSFSFDYPVRNIALGDGDGLHLCLLGMPLLETLYVKNFPCSARSLTHLGCLKKLGLLYDEPYIWQPVAAGAQPGLGGHAFSTFMVMLSHVRHAHVPGRPMFPTIGTPTRNALSLDELDDLDMNCPDLRMLKLEADRGINSWVRAHPCRTNTHFQC